MRGGIGLVSLMVTMAIILYLLAGKGCGGQSYLQTVMNVKKEHEPQAQQWGGKGPDGRPFTETFAFEAWPESGRLQGLEVTSVDPAGPAATFYGIQPGDIIVNIGPHEVGGPIVGSVPAGNDFLIDAFSKSYPLTVRRGETQLTLPDPASGVTTTPPGGLPNLPAISGGG